MDPGGPAIVIGGSTSEGGKPTSRPGGTAGSAATGTAGEPQGGSSGTGAAGAASAGSASAGKSAGGSAAGNSDGGTSGAAAGDAGSGGEGGEPPPPDDTGCLPLPWSGNQADLNEKLPGIDCSSCSNGAELGYTVPAFCAPTCPLMVSVSDLPKDVQILLPPGDAINGAACKEQACDDDAPIDLPGFKMQMLLQIDGSYTITTDENRRVLPRERPLVECAEAASCYAFNGKRNLAIVVKPNAPRGWMRVTALGGICK